MYSWLRAERDVKILVFDRYSSIITPLRLVFSGTVAVKRLRGVVGGSAEKAIVTQLNFFTVARSKHGLPKERGEGASYNVKIQ